MSEKWHTFNDDDKERRWAAPSVEATDGEQASAYRYLISICPTNGDALAKLREIRNAERKTRRG